MAASRNTFWGDLSSDFGAWHPPAASYRHQKACFDVTYESNSYGARDVERPRKADGPRVVVLGDSFMEGYGVALQHRMSNVLEAATGVPHMNFGTSGNAGPTHSFALYRSLIQGFEHSAVLCAILPENDFEDDLPQEGRYMPFWRGTPPALELSFPVPSISDSAWSRARAPAGFELDRFLRDFTYSRNVVDIFYVAWKQQRVRSKFDGSGSAQASRFFRYSRDEFDRLKHSYEQLARLAAPREVVIFTIPRVPDLAAYARERSSPLDEELAMWSSTLPNVVFVPLLATLFERFGEKATELFLSCDPHWGPAGHRAAADIVLERAGVILRGQ